MGARARRIQSVGRLLSAVIGHLQTSARDDGKTDVMRAAKTGQHGTNGACKSCGNNRESTESYR